jgi:hypothetical protein
MKTKITAEKYITISPEKIPKPKADRLASATLHAVERYFEKPGVKENYEKWLVEYRRTHPESEKAGA